MVKLSEEDGLSVNRKESIVSEYQSFTHLTYSKNKVRYMYLLNEGELMVVLLVWSAGCVCARARAHAMSEMVVGVAIGWHR